MTTENAYTVNTFIKLLNIISVKKTVLFDLDKA